MITVNLIDDQQIFTESVQLDEKGPQPANAVYEPVPALTGDQVAQWDGVKWNVLDVRPPVVVVDAVVHVPASVSRLAGKLALREKGLLDQVEAYVQNSTDAVLKLAWSDALTFERNSPFVAALVQQLGLTDAQLDELFILAGSIV